MKLIAIAPFSWAHRGVQVEHFDEGAEIETEDLDLVEVSIGEGWAKAEDGASMTAEDGLPDGGGPADPGRPDELLPPGADETPAPKPGRKAKAK